MPRTVAYKGFQLSQLRSFCLAANEGNFTAAARRLNLSVPAVWQQVRALERQLRVSLLRRRGRVVELTAEGRLLLGLVQPHVSGLDSLVPLFESRRADLPVTLNVASTHYLVAYHLPQTIREFAELHPEVRLNLSPGVGADAVQLVERAEVDLGVGVHDPAEPRSPYLDYEHLFDLRFTLATARDHPLARKKQVHPRDLVQYPIILQPKSGYNYKTLERLLRRHEVFDQLHAVLESPSTDTALKYVALGIGIAVTYAGRALGRALAGVRLRVFDPHLPVLAVALVTRKGAHLSEPARAFCRLVRRDLAEPNARIDH